ncbi:unnamed protein product [Notodromas monacha]|uniref:Uncharacterized protein n=1 Tax=Notodromas monacha TaxID=399045 RepID=A0A7R9BW58_9CRUS|nr:unnamed protein product [Notodromas monacha]CAG0921685.1 unnamed protein product [Notodromas monacha]
MYCSQVNKSDSFVFNGFNAVTFGTRDSLIALLSGQRIQTWRHLAGTHEGARFVDEVVPEFAWDTFRQNGYVTVFHEDTSHGSVFHNRTTGFRDPPVDHNSRVFMLAENASAKNCHYTEHMHKVFRAWRKSLWQEYQDKSKFMVALETDFVPAGKRADRMFLETLKWFNYNFVSNSTVLVVTSGHGLINMRVGLSIQGRIEARNPLLYMKFPPQFLKKHPAAAKNLRVNRNRLTTPLDVHATLVNLLNFDPRCLSHSDCQTGFAHSVLQPMKPHRTCADADIGPHFCGCATWWELQAKDPLGVQLAQAAVDYINNLVQQESPAPGLCSRFQFLKVKRFIQLKGNVQEFKPNPLVN